MTLRGFQLLGLAWLGYLGTAGDLAVASAQGQPRVRVQSGSQLQLHAERSDDSTVEFAGQLVDDLGDAIAGRPVSLTIRPSGRQRPSRLNLTTDGMGAFATRLESDAARYRVEASFTGDEHHLPVQRTLELQLDRSLVLLRWVEAPRVIDGQQERHRFVAQAVTSAGHGGLPMTLVADGNRILGSEPTDAQGRVAFSIETSTLRRTRGTLALVFEGDATRDAARLEHGYVKQQQPALSLTLERRAGRASIEARAQLSLDGQGLEQQPVGLFAGPRHIRTALTDASGSIEMELGEEELTTGGTRLEELQARFVSSSEALSDARSKKQAVPAPTTRPSAFWLALPLALWAWALFLQRRSGRAARATESTQAGGGGRPAVVELARPQTFARELFELSGRVFDSDTGEALVGARLQLARTGPGADGLEAITPGDGGFRLLAPGPGTYRLLVTRAGFEPASLELQLPHRGQWTGARIRIRNLRNVMWAESAALLNMSPATRDVAPTLHEACTPIIAARPGDRAFDALATAIERILYAREVPRHDNVQRAAKAVAKTVEAMQSGDPK